MEEEPHTHTHTNTHTHTQTHTNTNTLTHTQTHSHLLQGLERAGATTDYGVFLAFCRLCPYMDGTFSVQAMMRHEFVSPELLAQVLHGFAPFVLDIAF